MTRKKLTTHEIAFGARATYGARSAQHRRPRVIAFAKPVDGSDGQRVASSALYEKRGRCACGYAVCSKRGPCATAAPAVEAPKPAVAPWFAVGDRVRPVVLERAHEWPIQAGEYVVTEVASSAVDPCRYLGFRGDPRVTAGALFYADRFEPIAPAPEAPPADAESFLLAHGWTRATVGEHGWDGFKRPNALVNARDRGEGYAYAKRPGFADGHAPTWLQAACAALGIEIECTDGVWLAWFGGNAYDTGAIADAESCARAALAAYHARGGRS